MTTRIPIYQRRGAVAAYAMVDEVDAGWVKQWRWQRGGSGGSYARRSCRVGGRYTTTYMHALILERKLGRPIARGMVTDHVDRNPLNCTRDNLREVTQSQNCQNSRDRKSALGMRCVTKTPGGMFQVSLRARGKLHYGGRFVTAAEASAALANLRNQVGVIDCDATAPAPTPSRYARSAGHSKTGHRGVRFVPATEKWEAYTILGGKFKAHGCWHSPELAAVAAAAARRDAWLMTTAALVDGRPHHSRSGR